MPYIIPVTLPGRADDDSDGEGDGDADGITLDLPEPPRPKPMMIKLSPALAARFSGQTPEQVVAFLEDAAERACQPPAASPSPVQPPAPTACDRAELDAIFDRLNALESGLSTFKCEVRELVKVELNKLLRG